MKISFENNILNMNLFRNKSVNGNNSIVSVPFLLNNSLSEGADVVSFKSKNYDITDITSPTNHCAYCGCKVYTDAQIEGIAKEILNSKGDRLEGRIKSILEKFDDAKHSQEIALAKRDANKDEIDFFGNFLDISRKKSFLKGEAIFAEVYNLNKEKAFDLLIKNLHPLLRTIDHISPQNLNQKNNNVDINLVEACYTCNHDLKQGSSFEEFYTMFPDIKNNMPSEKFNFAASNLLNNSQDNIAQRLSATNLLKFIDRLFNQKNEISNSLSSVVYRIKCCNDSIASTVDSCREEIKNKEAEIDRLNNILEALNNDPEYLAIVKRNELLSVIDSLENKLNSLRDDKNKTSNSINNIRNEINAQSSKNSKKKNKPQKTVKELSPEVKKEKESEIEQLKNKLKIIDAEMVSVEEEKLEKELEIEDLNSKFPTIQILEVKKHKIDGIINAYSSFSIKNTEQNKLKTQMTELDTAIAKLKEQISLCPNNSFNYESLNEQDKALYNRYIELNNALKYIEEHINQGSVKGVINSVAKIGIENELADISKNSIIKDFESAELYKALNSELSGLEKQKNNLQNSLNSNAKQISILSSVISEMSLNEAKQKSSQYQEDMRRIIEKENQLKLPSIIEGIKSEIILIESTITELLNKQKKIDKVI